VTHANTVCFVYTLLHVIIVCAQLLQVVLGACAALCDRESALTVYEEMQRRGVSPDAISYNLGINKVFCYYDLQLLHSSGHHIVLLLHTMKHSIVPACLVHVLVHCNGRALVLRVQPCCKLKSLLQCTSALCVQLHTCVTVASHCTASFCSRMQCYAVCVLS
jgi:pentatricopeptide repeat protein